MRLAVLLFVVVFAMAGCSQTSSAPEQGEKQDVESGSEESPKAVGEATQAVAISCSDFPSSQHAMEYYSTDATEAEKRILDQDQDGFPCNEPGVAEAGEAAPEPTVIQPTPEFYRWNCRGETYVVEQGMDAAEAEAFGTEMGNRLADDLEAGGDKDMGDILDEMGVPAYEEQCGTP